MTFPSLRPNYIFVTTSEQVFRTQTLLILEHGDACFWRGVVLFACS